MTSDEMAEGLWTSTSEGNDRRGARSRDVPSRQDGAISDGRAVCDDNHQEWRQPSVMAGQSLMAGLKAMRI